MPSPEALQSFEKFNEEEEIFEQVSIPDPAAVKQLTQELRDSVSENVDETKEHRIDEKFATFFKDFLEKNEDKSLMEIKMVMPSILCIDHFLCKEFTKAFINSENFSLINKDNVIDIKDLARLEIQEYINNVAEHQNENHDNHAFYFYASIDKDNNQINFECRDFNPSSPKEKLETVNNNKTAIREDFDKLAEDLSDHGRGVDFTAEFSSKCECDDWCDKNGQRIGNIMRFTLDIKKLINEIEETDKN